ncbi:hypothetical protein BROUX41_001163 [Berkeleyomyces rouxiae]|uniref:uncharacterized protein n=1 Tax=Berkeleyomyces rouxiae TaxID=2035830 RepID=UPI003B783565
MPSQSVDNLKHSDLKAYKAVAGHDGTMCDSSGKLFIKPCTSTEIEFYEKLQSLEYDDLREFMPRFYGTLTLDQQAQVPDATSESVNVLNGGAVDDAAAAAAVAEAVPEVAEKAASVTAKAADSTEPAPEKPEAEQEAPAEECKTAKSENNSPSNLQGPEGTNGHPVESPSRSPSQFQLSSSEATPSTSLGSAADGEIPRKWIPNGGKRIKTDTAVVLENLSHGFLHPNILDCKLGTRLWGDDAPLEKRARFDKIAATTTHRNFGFRIAGMRAWHGSTDPADLDADDYMVYDRIYGRDHVTDDTLAATIRRFVFNPAAGITHELAQATCAAFAHELELVLDALRKHSFRIYSSSLLFIFEGDGRELARKIEARNLAIEEIERREDQSDDDELCLSAGLVGKSIESAAMLGVAGAGGSDQDEGEDENGDDEDEDEDDDDDDEQIPRTHMLRLIDFAHASFVPSGQGPDKGLLLGVESLMKLFQDMAQEEEPEETDTEGPQKKRVKTK